MAIRYIVNEKDRVVVALLEHTKRDAVQAANSWTGADIWNAPSRIDMHVHCDKKYLMPDKFTGVARCNPDDEWNEEIGKQIARDRVLNNYHKSLNKAVRRIHKDMIAEFEHFEKRMSKLRDNK